MFTAKKLERKTSLNEVVKSGLYYYPINSRMKDTPDGKESSCGMLFVIAQDDSQIQQYLVSFGNLYSRMRLEQGGWSPWINLSSGVEAYSLPQASEDILGGIRVGTGLRIDDEGVLDAEAYHLPVAGSDKLGGIRVGKNLSISSTGVLSANDQLYVLPYATNEKLGGIILGSGLVMDECGRVNVCIEGSQSPPQIFQTHETVENPYNLPIASREVLGGIRVGENLTIDSNGVLSAKTVKLPEVDPYELSIATKEELGGIRVDGEVFQTSDEGFLQVNQDKILPPEKRIKFKYTIENEDYLFDFSIEEHLSFLENVITSLMSSLGILGGDLTKFRITAKKENDGEEVSLSLTANQLLDLYVNRINVN